LNFVFSIGSIFGIWKKRDDAQTPLECILQSGEDLRCAGYAVYGSACMLVLATRDGVNGFTLDPVWKTKFVLFTVYSFLVSW
jgi:fructose-1,6-bisphosphatase I